MQKILPKDSNRPKYQVKNKIKNINFNIYLPF